MDEPGVELLNNRYRLEAELGRGGMGSVYRAHDTLLDRTVAVKLLRAPDEPGRERLLREAKAAARLNHPHIVAVHDVGVAGESAYIVMEFVDGDSLDKRNELGLEQIVAMAGQMAAALGHAHSHGIIHRDVKPENIMLTGGGKAKLMDFGLARPIASRITSEGTLVGTVFYVAPEQALGQAIDGRADLYALGVVLYELVAGRLPFTAEDPLAVISQHLYAPVVPPSAYNPDLPPVLESLILTMLSKRADDRPPSAALVQEALETMELSAPVPRQIGAGLAGLARGRFIGRESELALCKAAWLEAAAGARRVVLVEGEAGVGKTRLALEVASQVTVLGGRVLRGECYAEGAAPYAPIGEILREALAGDGAHDLGLPASILKDLAVLSPTLRGNTRRPLGGMVAEAQAELYRLCESVVFLLERLSQRAPVMLLIEDLQWADSGTLCIVRHLTHRAHVSDLRFLAVLTFRPVESVQARGLYGILRELERNGQTARVELQPFTRDETRRMLEAMFQREITDEFLEGIQKETGGNAFFVEEACKTLVAQGKLYLEAGRWERGKTMAELGIPQSLRTAILERFTHLTPETQDTLRRAAIIGQEIPVGVLQRASDFCEEILGTCLDEAERAQFIRVPRGDAMPGQRYAFAHALMPLAIAGELSSVQSARLHGRVGAAIEQLRADRLDHEAAVLGRHFAGAGQADKAADYLLRAGDLAQSVMAFEEAIEAYQQALPWLRLLNDPRRESETNMKLGSLYHATYRFDESRCAFREAFSVTPMVGAHAPDGSTCEKGITPAPHALRLHAKSPIVLDPCQITDDQDCRLVQQLLSGLVACDPDRTLRPEVASSWEVLEGGRRYVFHLRDEWRWSDGSPVTAHDFVYAWRRLLDPKRNSPSRMVLEVLSDACQSEAPGGLPPEGPGVCALDDLTLSVNLKEPAGYFMFMLAGAPLLPLPRHILESPRSRWSEGVGFVGNGAFTLEVGGASDTWTLRRNPMYPGRVRGNVDQIDLRLRRERTDAILDSGPEILAGYQTDELDMASLPPAEARRAWQHHPDQEVRWPTTAVYYLVLNRSRPPLSDLRVRRALGHGLNRSLLVALTYGEGVEPALGGLLPPTLPGHSPAIGLTFDLEVARRNLAEAGFPMAVGLGTIPVLHAPRQERHEMVRHLGALWGDVLGVRIQGVPCESAELHRRVREGDYMMAILGWMADYPDPDNFLRVLVQGFLSFQPDEDYTLLVRQAGRLMDQRQRTELYARADRLLADQAYILPIVYGQGRAFIKPWVRREPLWYSCDGYWKDAIIDPHE